MFGYDRCTNDDSKAASAVIGKNPLTGKPIEISMAGASATSAIHAAMLALSVAMKNGSEKDFIEKVAVALVPMVMNDPHALCPLVGVMSRLIAIAKNDANVAFTEDGSVIILPVGMTPDEYPECTDTCSLTDLPDEGDDEGYPPLSFRDDEEDEDNDGLEEA